MPRVRFVPAAWRRGSGTAAQAVDAIHVYEPFRGQAECWFRRRA